MNDTCTRCGRAVSSYEGVIQSDGRGNSLGFVCGRCWTALLSEQAGENFGHLEIDPIVMRDATGREHEFHVRYIPAPRGVEAFELVDGSPGGYQFQVLQEDEEPGIVERLLDRMRRALSQQHLQPCAITPGGLCIKGNTVRGRIEWDEEQEGRLPSVVIDGQPISWNRLGSMLMTFEGSPFRLEVLDRSEEA